MTHTLLLIVLIALCSACQTTSSTQTLYTQLGEQAGVEKIADKFVRLLIRDPRTEQYFKETNLDRLYEKLVEQFCQVSDGPCEYTGDDMVTVHKGMSITEADFNAVVEIMQQALRDSDVPLPAQNRLLARLAKMRKDMLYR